MSTYHSHTLAVLHSWMHYLEVGSGRPVLLDGNPTSSFLWSVLFLPEDRPQEVAAAVTDWVRQLP